MVGEHVTLYFKVLSTTGSTVNKSEALKAALKLTQVGSLGAASSASPQGTLKECCGWCKDTNSSGAHRKMRTTVHKAPK